MSFQVRCVLFKQQLHNFVLAIIIAEYRSFSENNYPGLFQEELECSSMTPHFSNDINAKTYFRILRQVIEIATFMGTMNINRMVTFRVVKSRWPYERLVICGCRHGAVWLIT
jgi:hypothetical protein